MLSQETIIWTWDRAERTDSCGLYQSYTVFWDHKRKWLKDNEFHTSVPWNSLKHANVQWAVLDSCDCFARNVRCLCSAFTRTWTTLKHTAWIITVALMCIFLRSIFMFQCSPKTLHVLLKIQTWNNNDGLLMALTFYWNIQVESRAQMLQKKKKKCWASKEVR